MAPRIEVRGIRELNKALKQVDAELPKELRLGFKRISEMVVSSAQGKVPVISGAARSSIKPRAAQKGAGIAFGGTKAPYFPWLNFGGNVGRRKSVHRDRITPDRYIYTSINEMGPQIEQEIDLLLKEVIQDAGFDTKGGV